MTIAAAMSFYAHVFFAGQRISHRGVAATKVCLVQALARTNTLFISAAYGNSNFGVIHFFWDKLRHLSKTKRRRITLGLVYAPLLRLAESFWLTQDRGMRKLPFVNKRAGRRSAMGNAGGRSLKRQGASSWKRPKPRSPIQAAVTTRPAASNALGHVRLKTNVSVFDGPVIARQSIRLGACEP